MGYGLPRIRQIVGKKAVCKDHATSQGTRNCIKERKEQKHPLALSL